MIRVVCVRAFRLRREGDCCCVSSVDNLHSLRWKPPPPRKQAGFHGYASCTNAERKNVSVYMNLGVTQFLGTRVVFPLATWRGFEVHVYIWGYVYVWHREGGRAELIMTSWQDLGARYQDWVTKLWLVWLCSCIQKNFAKVARKKRRTGKYSSLAHIVRMRDMSPIRKAIDYIRIIRVSAPSPVIEFSAIPTRHRITQPTQIPVRISRNRLLQLFRTRQPNRSTTNCSHHLHHVCLREGCLLLLFWPSIKCLFYYTHPDLHDLRREDTCKFPHLKKMHQSQTKIKLWLLSSHEQQNNAVDSVHNIYSELRVVLRLPVTPFPLTKGVAGEPARGVLDNDENAKTKTRQE